MIHRSTPPPGWINFFIVKELYGDYICRHCKDDIRKEYREYNNIFCNHKNYPNNCRKCMNIFLVTKKLMNNNIARWTSNFTSPTALYSARNTLKDYHE